jgi:ribosomal protein L40E
MSVCAKCGGDLTRRHRRWYQRFVYRQVLQCRKCGAREPMPREFTLKPTAHVQCPRCHTYKVSRRIAPDKIDPVIKSMSSMLQSVLGGRLYHCNFCRIQFYDLRHSMKPQAKNGPDAGPSVTKTEEIAL